MKLITLIGLLISSCSFAQNIVEIGYSAGQLNGDPVTTSLLQIGHYRDTGMSLAGGKLGYGAGVRSSFYQADTLELRDGEELEDINFSAHNIFIQADYSIEKYKIGFNLDIFGLSTSTSSDIDGTNNSIDNETTNLFLGGKSDKGSLNSHLFLMANFSPVTVKAGLSHAVIQFDDEGLSGDKKRQQFFDSAFVMVGYSF